MMLIMNVSMTNRKLINLLSTSMKKNQKILTVWFLEHSRR